MCRGEFIQKASSSIVGDRGHQVMCSLLSLTVESVVSLVCSEKSNSIDLCNSFDSDR